MNDKITVYQKPTCTKCREVIKALMEKGVAFEAINYFEQPLTAETLEALLKSAGLKPAEAIRKNETAYREFVAHRDLNDDELIRVMAEHPELIQRPLVVRGKKAVLARPADRLSELGL